MPFEIKTPLPFPPNTTFATAADSHEEARANEAAARDHQARQFAGTSLNGSGEDAKNNSPNSEKSPRPAQAIARESSRKAAHFPALTRPHRLHEQEPLSSDLRDAVDPLAEDIRAAQAQLPPGAQQGNPLAVRAFFRDVFNPPTLDHPSRQPSRIKCAYRLIREMAHMRGLVHQSQSLQDALIPDQNMPDYWVTPLRLKGEPAKNTIHPYFSWKAYRVMAEAERLDPVYHVLAPNPRCPDNEEEAIKTPGFALLPPSIPKGFKGPNYNPDHDLNLVAYCCAVEAIAISLHIRDGGHYDRQYGIQGMEGLENPTLVRGLFPSAVQVMTYEALLVDYTLNIYVEKGQKATQDHLYLRYGFLNHEIESLIKQAKALANRRMTASLEEERAMVVMRLEDYIRRCREVLAIKDELNGIKQLAMVLGVTRMEPEDAMADFLGVVKTVENERLRTQAGALGEGIGRGIGKGLEEARERALSGNTKALPPSRKVVNEAE